MFGAAKKFYLWASSKAKERFAPIWLGIIYLTELIFFIPMDAILLVFCLENPSRRYHYALMATLASAITATAGYFLGHLLWDFLQPHVIDHWISSSFFNRITDHYLAVQHWAVFLGSLLPVPFKAITLSAGVCHLPFFPFLIAVIAARLVRFFLIAAAVQKWGDQMRSFIDKHFHKFVIGVGIKIAFVLSFFWALS
jgi:membrane protein YqaA with SNARE-associated domain